MGTLALKENYFGLINNRLDELFPLRDIPQKELLEATRYSLLGPGKRLRPLLVLSVLHGYQVAIPLGLDPACAIECVHTYSLIHDDLPCMDNDDLRRGRPTLHKVFSEGLAVLTGDFLLTTAFDILVQTPQLSHKQKIDLVHTLSQRAGSHGMIGGQVVDLVSEGVSINWETLHFMHFHKTAALFIACLEFGAIIAQTPEEDRKKLKRCGQDLGVAFQALDDLRDDFCTEGTTCSDSINKKATTVSVLGAAKTLDITHRLLDEALKEVYSLSKPCPLLEALIKEIFLHIPNLNASK
jgi:geranylgeranyl diphosphate synthase, type II